MSKAWLFVICVLCIIADYADAVGSSHLSRSSNEENSENSASKEGETIPQYVERIKRELENSIKKPGVNEAEDDKKKIYFYPPPNAESTEKIDLSDLENGKYSIQCHKQSTTKFKDIGDWVAVRTESGKWKAHIVWSICDESKKCTTNFYGWSFIFRIGDQYKAKFNEKDNLETWRVRNWIYQCWEDQKYVVLHRAGSVPATIIYPKKGRWDEEQTQQNENDGVANGRKEYDDMYLRGFARGFKAGLKRH